MDITTFKDREQMAQFWQDVAARLLDPELDDLGNICAVAACIARDELNSAYSFVSKIYSHIARFVDGQGYTMYFDGNNRTSQFERAMFCLFLSEAALSGELFCD